MILLAAVWFIPIYYLIVTTFKNPQEATQSPSGTEQPDLQGTAGKCGFPIWTSFLPAHNLPWM